MPYTAYCKGFRSAFIFFSTDKRGYTSHVLKNMLWAGPRDFAI
jgi:hypothetical protein